MKTVRCAYCDKDLLASADNFIAWQTDHIVPRAKCGPNESDNLVDACWQCNHVKSSFDPRDIAGEDAGRDELIAVVRAEMQKWRAGYEQDRCGRLKALQGGE